VLKIKSKITIAATVRIGNAGDGMALATISVPAPTTTAIKRKINNHSNEFLIFMFLILRSTI